MKKIILALLLLPFIGLAQVDMFHYSAITLGLKYKSTSHEGTYGAVANGGSGQAAIASTDKVNTFADHGSAINIDAQYYIFSPRGYEMYNLDGLIYLLSYFGNMGSNHSGELYYSLANLITTPSDHLASVPCPVDFNKAARFLNFNLIDIKGSFGKRKLLFGGNMTFKVLGIRGPFTWFVDKNYQSVYHNLIGTATLRTLFGPTISYRTNLKPLGLVAIAGVNFCPNRDQFKISYNPYVQVMAFAGTNRGVTAGLKYEMIAGKSKINYTDGTNSDDNVKISQLELNVAFVINKNKTKDQKKKKDK